jgi:glycosyltransferase involved in cell wall biosynthesis
MACSESITPLISVITPCYRQAQYLAEALDSVLAQTYLNWECVIVNDGSDDNTDIIAKDYLKKDPRFKYIYQENQGLSAARNAGIKNTTGEYILPLDADDKIGPQYLEKAMKYFTSHPETTLVYAHAQLFGIEEGVWFLKPYNYIDLLKSNLIYCSAMFKRADFNITGQYDENLRTGYEDWDLYIRMLNADSIVHKLNEVHFFYRVKTVSMITAITMAHQQKLNYFIYQKHQHIYQQYFESPINLLRRLDLYESMYKNSPDYKLGNKLVNPFRFLVKTISSVFK